MEKENIEPRIMPAAGALTVMIVDDHHIVRHGLKQSLELEKGINVVAEAENGRSAVRMMAKIQPDIVLMDVSMPDLNGIEATKQILKEYGETKIIALSVHADKQYVLSMIKAGAKGYLLKTNLFEQLLTAIRTVAAGNAYLCPEITEFVVDTFMATGQANEDQAISSLSQREREVLQMLSEGRNSAYISEQLCISKKTVDAHKRNIMKKLDVDNIPALTKIAIRYGITNLDS